MNDVHSTQTNGDGAANGAGHAPRRGVDPLMQVRASDVEPYTGLGYLSKLFRLIAIFLVVLLVLEVGTGLYQQGTEALPTLLSEVSRLVVLAGLLWGVGDLANLLIDVGHDVRAARILLGRQVAQSTGGSPERERPTERVVERASETTNRIVADGRRVASSTDEPDLDAR
jgi:hypothetical protein